MDFDWKLGDAELFTRFFCPIAPSVNCLGDLWLDVTCLQPYLLQCLVIFPLVWDFRGAPFFFVFGTIFGRKKVALLNPFRSVNPMGK